MGSFYSFGLYINAGIVIHMCITIQLINFMCISNNSKENATKNVDKTHNFCG